MSSYVDPTIGERLDPAQTLCRQGDRELNEGNLRLASETFWRAAAQVLKSFAEKHNLDHDSHSHAYRVIREAVCASRNPEVGEWFKHAEALHGNFYENWMIEFEIRSSAEDVRRFIELVERV